MLTPEERSEIEAEFSRYPKRESVCIDAMKIVQKHRGWVSDESIRDICGLLEERGLRGLKVRRNRSGAELCP